MRARLGITTLISASLLTAGSLAGQATQDREPLLPREKLAQENFGADAPWFLRNIPFVEIDDPAIQQIYYYRWKLYRSHIREIGPQGTTVLEFLTDVPWAREPYTDLNDSASFHIMEGRWLRDPAIVDSLIDHLYTGAGNDRHFSESVAAATESSTRVTGDVGPGLRHLDTMQYIFNLWDDHLDRQRNLYWIEPVLDATEYTISSIDASGAGFSAQASSDENRNGFKGGYAYRPTINSYQYANALAIARFAELAGKPDVAADYRQRAERIRGAVLEQLWNRSLQHFTDRYQRTTPFVKKGDFIRGRELAGYLPWFYDLPPKPVDGQTGQVDYAAAWRHLLSSAELAGPDGMRTVEPSYPRYMTQYRYDRATGKPECQWNGPSWPFQTSQALTALANLLNDYQQTDISRVDYLHLLRQYTQQHFISPGHPDIQEDYNPDTGGPIVGLDRSHHYSHSTYVDLILSGLIGIRPRADEILEINPLLPTETTPGTPPIRYFGVQGVLYHGHEVTAIFDADGSRYGRGRGLSVFVDGKRAFGPGPLGRVEIALPDKASVAAARRDFKMPVDYAVNPGWPDGPSATASSSVSPQAIAEAIDGRMWFFPENPNGWSPDAADKSPSSWYSVAFKQSRTVGSIELYFFGNGEHYQAPSAYELQYRTANSWQDIPGQKRSPEKPLANGVNRIEFPAVSTQELRVIFTNPPIPDSFRLIEIKAFAP
ncbi:MAG: discoidin domain-containing protein [Terracidiphilus sp.]